ncbi:MAG: LysM domain-containing protein [Dehalococcoidia bacterium]|nr:LysM domain-containing protein [Dehalococcoidia bacterium]
MNDPLEQLRQAGALNTSPFEQNSRYYGLPIARYERPGADPIPYVRRRFIPPVERYTEVERHHVQQGDRIDRLAAHYLGDPERYWQIADANAAMDPADLTATPGDQISITLPDGIGGGSDG